MARAIALLALLGLLLGGCVATTERLDSRSAQAEKLTQQHPG